MPTSAKRFDLVELVAIVCFVAVATAVAWNFAFWVEPHDKYTIDPRFHTEFLKRYGPERFSSGLEEYIIRDFFQDRRDGVFVDVGAYHAREHSNTYRLERDLGWQGLAIDANASFAPEYQQHRPRTRFITAFVGDTDTGTGTLHVYEREPIVASGDPSFTAEWGKPTQTMTAPNRTLNSLLRESG
ncbi:MAG: hypothetical protein JJE40_15980, partial [Vicinamibacteria bacterium]|nr:hypothetical protein [Vicinamibacteria bacterium]